MTFKAVCARYGGVQPSEFDDLHHLEAFELAKRLLDLHRQEQEALAHLHLELTKVMVKALGVRMI